MLVERRDHSRRLSCAPHGGPFESRRARTSPALLRRFAAFHASRGPASDVGAASHHPSHPLPSSSGLTAAQRAAAAEWPSGRRCWLAFTPRCRRCSLRRCPPSSPHGRGLTLPRLLHPAPPLGPTLSNTASPPSQSLDSLSTSAAQHTPPPPFRPPLLHLSHPLQRPPSMSSMSSTTTGSSRPLRRR